MASYERVNVRELRQNLSRYLRRVGAGETLRVAERGRPVALLSPLPEAGGALERLIGEGKLQPARLDLLELGEPPAAPALRLRPSRALALLRRD